MRIFGRKRTDAPAAAAMGCERCGSRDVAVGYVDRVTVTVTRRCERCSHEWREPFVDLTSVGPVLNGHR